ncbi:MAG: cysteine synthase family protein [Clostridia bacterium]|nr:cysteine synthase family protein [Clostridia bacterium]
MNFYPFSNTPIIEIEYRYQGKTKKAFFKAEWFNLTGSIKDRVAFAILTKAQKNGLIKENQPVVEVTSGNMGISLSAMCALQKRPLVAILPKYMSQERKTLLSSFGATVVESEDFDHAFILLEEFVKSGAFCPKQFENEENALAHYNTTAKEIVSQMQEKISCFVAGVGTAGTLMGVGKYLHEKYFNTRLVAVEPSKSPLLSQGLKGKHLLQGLADERVPKLYDKTAVDQIISVDDLDAVAMAQKLAKVLGLGVGISSGANFVACVKCKVDNAVSVFADDNKKYMSTLLATPQETEFVKSIDLLNYKIIR